MIIKINNRLQYSLDNVGSVFIFLSLFFPDSFRVLRLVIFIIWAAICLFEKRMCLSKHGTIVVVIFLVFNVLFLLNGLLNDAPGALRIMTVDFLWPAIFIVIVQCINSQFKITKIMKVMLYSYLAVCAFDVLYLITQMLSLNLPMMDKLVKVLDCNYGRYGAFIQYTTTHMCTHIFMLPFSIALLFTGKYQNIIKFKYLLVILFMGMFCTVASSRVAFQLVVVISIPFSLFVKKFILKERTHFHRKTLYSILLGTILIVCITVGILRISSLDLSESLNYIVYKLQISQDENNVRALQQDALLAGWIERPFIGHGTGSYTMECIRDEAQVWAYEYTYFALLFQKGILGFIIFFGFVGWILLRMIKAVRCNVYSIESVLPFIIGLVCILIANYSNPYLGKFGCMWMIYIPFAISNSFTPSNFKVKFINGMRNIYAKERTISDSVTNSI